MAIIAMKVNDTPVEIDVPDRTLLIHVLRDHLRLTGAHVGCDTSQCGACTVHLPPPDSLITLHRSAAAHPGGPSG